MRKSTRYLMTLSLGGGLAGCSDTAQFTENPTAYRSGEVAAEKPNVESTLETETVADQIDTSESSAEPGLPSSSPTAVDPQTNEPIFRQATSSGSGSLTNDTGTQGQALSQTQRDALLAQCSTKTLKTITRQIMFPKNENCRWLQDGNLDRRNTYLQAAEAQSSSISLPLNTQLCSMAVGSQAGTLHYDDFIVLTLNGYILLSSNKAMLPNLLGSASTAYQWDFNRVKGKAADFDSPAYCLGDGSSACQVPVTDIPGQFRFEINPNSLLHLADRVYDKQNLNFSLIATGDNDDRDCFHTDMTLEFTLQYVEK